VRAPAEAVHRIAPCSRGDEEARQNEGGRGAYAAQDQLHSRGSLASTGVGLHSQDDGTGEIHEEPRAPLLRNHVEEPRDEELEVDPSDDGEHDVDDDATMMDEGEGVTVLRAKKNDERHGPHIVLELTL